MPATKRTAKISTPNDSHTKPLTDSDKVSFLMYLSRSFFLKATTLSSSSKLSKSHNGLLTYFKLIKSSINCLLITLNKFHNHLNYEKRIQLHYKVALLLFLNTNNYELATFHINKALFIVNNYLSKTNDINDHLSLILKLKLLYFKVIFSSSKRQSLNYLNSIINDCSLVKKSNSNLVNLLNFIKIQHFNNYLGAPDTTNLKKNLPSSNDANSSAQNISILSYSGNSSSKQLFFNLSNLVENIYSNLSNDSYAIDKDLRLPNNLTLFRVACVTQLYHYLIRGDLISAKDKNDIYKTRLSNLQENKLGGEQDSPIQLTAMETFLSLNIAIGLHDTTRIEKELLRLEDINKSIESHWIKDSFASSSHFIIDVPITKLESFPITFKWIGPKEYQIVCTFYLGVTLLENSISSSRYNKKTSEAFEKCYSLISKELISEIDSGAEQTQQHALSIWEYEEKIMRLTYMRLLISFYDLLNLLSINELPITAADQDNTSTILSMLSHKPSLRYLIKFIKDYDSKKFSSQELIVYQPIILKVYYILAVLNQRDNNLQKAQYYFIKLRKFINNSMSLSIESLTSLESELYYLSTLHLIILYTLEISQFKTNKQADNLIQYEDLISVRSTLINELNQLIEKFPTPKDDDDITYLIISITLKIIKEYVVDYPTSIKSESQLNLSTNQLNLIEEAAPLLAALVNFIRADQLSNTTSGFKSEFKSSRQLFEEKLSYLKKSQKLLHDYSLQTMTKNSLKHFIDLKSLELFNLNPLDLSSFDPQSEQIHMLEESISDYKRQGKKVYQFQYQSDKKSKDAFSNKALSSFLKDYNDDMSSIVDKPDDSMDFTNGALTYEFQPSRISNDGDDDSQALLDEDTLIIE